MTGLGVTVLEVVVTDVLLAVEASAMVAIWTASTPSLAITMAACSVPIFDHKQVIDSCSFDKLANDAVALEFQGVWS